MYFTSGEIMLEGINNEIKLNMKDGKEMHCISSEQRKEEISIKYLKLLK